MTKNERLLQVSLDGGNHGIVRYRSRQTENFFSSRGIRLAAAQNREEIAAFRRFSP